MAGHRCQRSLRDQELRKNPNTYHPCCLSCPSSSPRCLTASVSVLQVLQTLGTETYRPSSASQCVAGIACAEIPVNQWPELIPQLVANVTDPSSTEHMKESTLEAIGYICQDIVSRRTLMELVHLRSCDSYNRRHVHDVTLSWLLLQEPEQLQENANQILTAIIQGMRKEEPSNNVKLAATNALLNSLEFTKANFDKEVRDGTRHRPSILTAVCNPRLASKR